MSHTTIWPQTLWIVRHGESAGNVAREAANASGLDVIDIDVRDVDVPLSPLGELQAAALGKWFGEMPRGARPNVVLSSPYNRALRTAEIIREHAALDPLDPANPVILDERLREKEFGILDRLTRRGIQSMHPDQHEFRRMLGKFYHRPPGGESWTDVILRLRSAVEMISREYCGERVLVVAHSVVVLCLRYILEHMTEEQILAIDRETEIANCSVTRYDNDMSATKNGKLILGEFNFVAPLEHEGAPVTSAPDAVAGAK
ncbi:MAG TPA: histidine phosphatase family protein [Gemmatimonadaceae bacterium]|nr:histidine phosphatase family protein [Gemmatimonadaceae bacterium]